MSIGKFRLGWRSNPQQQYDELQKMVMHLQNISNGINSIGGQLNVLPALLIATQNQTLLLQQISDNTSCACNALQNLITLGEDTNSKLDTIIDILENTTPPEPAPVYEFFVEDLSLTLSDGDIAGGSINVRGFSLKDSELFYPLNILDCPDWLNPVIAYGSNIKFTVNFTGLPIPPGNHVVRIQQPESGIIQQIELIREASAANYVRLVDGAIIPILNPLDVASLCSTSSGVGAITINGITFLKNRVAEVCLVDSSLLPDPSSIPSDFCRYFASMTALTLPYSEITSIGDYFLMGCTSFNQLVPLPEGLLTIGTYFLHNAFSFVQPLSFPSTLTSVGYGLLWGSYNFTGPFNIGTLLASIFDPRSGSLASSLSNGASYVQGILILGDNAEDFCILFPNLSGFENMYRNLRTYYALTYDSNGGTLSGGTPAGDYLNGETITLPTFAAKDGCTFVAFVASDGEYYALGDTLPMPSSDLLVVAKWSPLSPPLGLIITNSNPLDIVEFAVVPGTRPVDWVNDYLYSVGPAETLPNVDIDADHNSLIAGNSYTLYWQSQTGGTSGSVWISDMQDGSTYPVG